MSGGAMSEGHTRSASGAFGPEEAGFFGWDFDSHLEAAMALRTSASSVVDVTPSSADP